MKKIDFELRKQLNREKEGRRKLKKSIYLMGTTAYHKLGDISSEKENLFRTSEETDNYYIGMWVTGFGFFDVMFPKETSRPLTKEEIKKYNKMYTQINDQFPQKLKVD